MAQKKYNRHTSGRSSSAAREQGKSPAYKELPQNRLWPHSIIVHIYLILMFSFFTLFLTKKYSNARHDKFYLYITLSLIMLVLAGLGYFLFYLVQGSRSRRVPPFFQPLSVTDVAFASFILFALLSTLCSQYFPETLLGEVGRNNGMLLLAFYALVYLFVSRMYIERDYIAIVYLAFSCITALLTVVNFFYIDPLGIFENYSESVVKDFGATIGNKNTIASYMSMFLPVALMTLVLNERLYMRIIGGVTLGFAYMGALCANSGSVFLGLGVAIPVMAIFAAQSYDRLKRYMLGLTVIFASGKLLMLFSHLLGDNHKGFENIQHTLIYDTWTYIPLAVCAVITVVMYALQGVARKRYPAMVITIILIALIGRIIAVALFAVLYFSLIDKTTDLGSLEKLLRFNDRWGTHRGFMWIRSMDEYGDFNFFKKLFGAGPDTAYYVLEPHFPELMARFNNSSTDCAHNEYINYLITQGALGLLSYLTILGSVCIRAFRRAKQNPIVLVYVSAIICYAVQATVNIYQPITTPLFFLFISITEALNRQTPLQLQPQK